MPRGAVLSGTGLTAAAAAAQGIKLARTDGQVFLFLNAKCKRLFNNKLKASKLAWTALYRKAHKKDQSTESARRKRRSTKVTATRSIVGASLEVRAAVMSEEQCSAG